MRERPLARASITINDALWVPVVQAKKIYLPYHARDISKLLFALCMRQFRWMATDLLRGRLTSSIGYLRLQAESVALMHLLLNDPIQADAWFAAGLTAYGGRKLVYSLGRQHYFDLGLAIKCC